MPSGFVLPDHTRSGARRWTDPVVADVVHRLHHGDPTLGWEGDDRLGLFEADPATGYSWELWRFDEQGGDSMVCRGRAGAPLRGIIPALVAHDTRKAGLENLEREVAKAERDAEARLDASLEQAVDDFFTAATVHKGQRSARTN